jgi:hypothetical protein
MLKLRSTRCLGALVLVVYAIAMVTVGLTRHDGGRSTDLAVNAQSLAAYQLPGIAAVPFCQHGAETGDEVPVGHLPAGHDCCDACVLAHAPGLSWVETAAIADRETVAIAYGATDAHFGVPIRRTEPTSRGPPTA